MVLEIVAEIVTGAAFWPTNWNDTAPAVTPAIVAVDGSGNEHPLSLSNHLPMLRWLAEVPAAEHRIVAVVPLPEMVSVYAAKPFGEVARLIQGLQLLRWR